MSSTKTITLVCDHATSSSSRACEQTYALTTDRVTSARDAAAELGWTHRGGDDFCAIHAADAEGAAS